MKGKKKNSNFFSPPFFPKQQKNSEGKKNKKFCHSHLHRRTIRKEYEEKQIREAVDAAEVDPITLLKNLVAKGIACWT